MTRDEEEMNEFVNALASAVACVVDLCERVGCVGFALYKCEKCPDYHAGVATRGDAVFMRHRGTSDDAEFAVKDMLWSMFRTVESMGIRPHVELIVEGLSDSIEKQLDQIQKEQEDGGTAAT